MVCLICEIFSKGKRGGINFIEIENRIVISRAGMAGKYRLKDTIFSYKKVSSEGSNMAV